MNISSRVKKAEQEIDNMAPGKKDGKVDDRVFIVTFQDIDVPYDEWAKVRAECASKPGPHVSFYRG